jgi:uncharacterized membrane protein/RNA polymerase subunit RPABC4/transcription elongation factor Spt4
MGGDARVNRQRPGGEFQANRGLSIFRSDFLEQEERIFREVNGGIILKIYRGASLACRQAAPLSNRDIVFCLLPWVFQVRLFAVAARKANIALHEANASDWNMVLGNGEVSWRISNPNCNPAHGTQELAYRLRHRQAKPDSACRGVQMRLRRQRAFASLRQLKSSGGARGGEMAHCTKCGATVQENAAFCPSCGAQQTAARGALQGTAPANSEGARSQAGMAENIAAMLSYVLVWVTGLIFYFIDKRPYVRFHATQSIVVFGGWHVVMFFLTIFFGVSIFGGAVAGASLGLLLYYVLQLAGFVLWIVCMVKANQGVRFRVPVAADLAEKIFGRN